MLAWIRESVSELGRGPLVVQSDVLRSGRPFARYEGRAAWLDAHVALLAATGRPLWMPTFHYGFTRDGWFDVRESPSEVGALTERFRFTSAAWRTPVPVFSFAGTGDVPEVATGPLIDPFDERSAFAAMVRDDAVLLFYGAPFSVSTIKHHAERRSGGPLYRFDKDFAGVVRVASGASLPVALRYHVRPLGLPLSYEDDRIERELETDVGAAGLRRFDRVGATLLAVSARRAVDAWLARLASDPLYFLDAPSRAWIEPALERLGRRFERSDFEGPDATVHAAGTADVADPTT